MSKGGGTAIGRGHQRIGVMPCVLCEREIPVKRTEGGKLSCCCTWCDLPLYVNPRTEAFELAMRRVKLDQVPEAAELGEALSNDLARAKAPPAAAPIASSSSPAPVDPPARSFTGPLARKLGNPWGG